MSTAEVRFETRNHVAYITIDRPERRNSLSLSVMSSLAEAFTIAGEDNETWAILLTATGEHAFCAGADLKELDEIAREGRRFPMPMTGVARNLFELVLETAKPVIAALNGPALAGGAELALACDIRIAAEHSYFSLPEAKRGMGANFASVLLPRLVPRAVALELLYLGEPMSAARARDIGLYNEVVPGHQLVDRAEAFVRRVVANAPLTLRRYKEMTTKGWELPIASALRLNVGPNPYLSADREEGIRAFVEKREPQWRGI